MEQIKDPYHHKERYENWAKEKKINGISKINESIIIKFLDDMALGLNVSRGSKKGGRSPARLNNLRQRLVFIVKELEKKGIKNIKRVTALQLHKLFENMRSGVISNRFGQPYKYCR